MEKRVFLAIIVSFAILAIFAQRAEPPVDPNREDPGKTESTSTPGTDTPEPGKPDTSGKPAPKGAATLRGADVTPFAGDLVLQNQTHRLVFDQRGAVLRSGLLLEFDATVESKDVEGPEGRLELIRTYDGGLAAFGLARDDGGPGEPSWYDGQLWRTTGPSADGQELSFELDVDEGGESYRITKTFRLGAESRRIEADVVLTPASEGGSVGRTLWLTTSGGVYPPERTDISGSMARTLARSVCGHARQGELELFSVTAAELLGEDGGTKIFSQSVFTCDMGVYFGAYLRHLDGGKARGARIHAIDPKATTRADIDVRGPVRTWSQLGVQLSSDGAPAVAKFDYYLGPKDHRFVRKAYEEGPLQTEYLDLADGELMSQGFCCFGQGGPVGWLIQLISKAVVWVLTFFNGVFGSMGVAIIILTVCVRMIMFPVTRKSQVAMQEHSRKMAKIKPKLEALKEKYKDDRQKFAQEQMKLMKEEKMQMVPLGGCLPLFLQIPIFFGLFTAIRFDVDLRHAPFLWCSDLSMPDRVISWEPWHLPCCIGPGITIDGLNIFPLLMIAAMFVHQLGMPKSPDPQMQQQQKMMMFMPILFGFLLYGYAAGLAVYWLSSSLFGIFEQRVIKKLFPIDKDKEPKPAAS